MMLRTTQIISIPTPKKVEIRVEMSKGLDGAAFKLESPAKLNGKLRIR